MNFQQLRSVRETARRGFNLTEVAISLNTSQPGISRQIRELENELGVDLFVRAGKRLTGLTQLGTVIMPIVEKILTEADNMRHAGAEFANKSAGILSIAATHSQARYALPEAVQAFRQRFPDVRFNLHQGSPAQVADMLALGEADIGIATEALDHDDRLIALPCYRWTHDVIVPKGHPLLDDASITLERLAEFPIITYSAGFTGRGHIDAAFEQAGIAFDLVISAMDADIIKTYVELGMGVGIVASIAFDEVRDSQLQSIDARHLFKVNLTRLALHRNRFLRSYVYDFIETFAPALTREVVEDSVAAAELQRAIANS
ncbi:CysB family HTH-type transcriptional regulator [soil metagenome]